LLKKDNDITDDDCDYIKNVLQAAVNSRIASGYLLGLYWAFTVSSYPLIKIAMVEVDEMYINIGILLTNKITSANAANVADKPKPKPNNDFTDPLF